MKNIAVQCMFWSMVAFLFPAVIIFLSSSSDIRKAISMLVLAGFWCSVAFVCYVCALLNKSRQEDDFQKGQSCRSLQLGIYKRVETERDVLKAKVAELADLVKRQAQTNMWLETTNRKLEADLFHEKRSSRQVMKEIAPLKRELQLMKEGYVSLEGELERIKTDPKTEIGRLYQLSQAEIAGAKHTASNLREAEQAAEDRATKLEQQLQLVAADAYARGRQSLVEEAEQWVAAEKAKLRDEAMAYIAHHLQGGLIQAQAQAPAAQTLSVPPPNPYHAERPAPPGPTFSFVATPPTITPAQPAKLAAPKQPALARQEPAKHTLAAPAAPQQVSSTPLVEGSAPKRKRGVKPMIISGFAPAAPAPKPNWD